MCKQIADKLGVQMEVQDMGFSALLSSVTSGKVDIAVGGVNPTPEREKAMAFSDIYLPTEQKLLVLKKNEHLYKDMADLDGKTIGAEKSTTQETTAQSIKGANVIGLSSVPDAILQLKNGKLDGIVVEGVVAKQYLVFNDDLALADVQFQGAKKVSAVALPKGSDDVLKLTALSNKIRNPDSLINGLMNTVKLQWKKPRNNKLDLTERNAKAHSSFSFVWNRNDLFIIVQVNA